MTDKAFIYKSKQVYEQKHPYIAGRGDIRASFKTRKEANQFVKNKLPFYYMSSSTNMGTLDVEAYKKALKSRRKRSGWHGERRRHSLSARRGRRR